MKKIVSIATIIFIISVLTLPIFASNTATTSASEQEGNEILQSENGSEFSKMKEESEGKLAQYEKKYGSKAYGITAMVLDAIRIYSIPFCFAGIVCGAIYQYVIGIRRLDIRDRGLNLVIAFVTILVICQILPLIFAIVARGWVL